MECVVIDLLPIYRSPYRLQKKVVQSVSVVSAAVRFHLGELSGLNKCSDLEEPVMTMVRESHTNPFNFFLIFED